MIEPLLVAVAVLLLISVVLLFVLLTRNPKQNVNQQLESQLLPLKEHAARLERITHEEIAANREEATLNARQARDEMGNSLATFGDSLLSRMSEIANLQKNQLDIFANQINALSQANELRLDKMRETVEQRLKLLQDDNSARLEQMRATVDEKLHATLEQRLGESFKLVSERLELVHKGLGEMQTLASGVGDLKKVLTNIKTRGTWGEIQLGNLLEQILTPEQFSKNVITKWGSNDRVEFAIKLPGRNDGNGKNIVWLPIDAKFPQEDYQRLIDAQEQASPVLVEEAGKQLEIRIKGEARTIKEKYLDPPHTTDFGIMFLPTEGLYAEVTRRTGLCELLQREYRVSIAGPNTLAAFLNSLQMGFRTLAIEKRTSEVWSLLGAVKTEFGRFGEALDKTKKKLEEASNTIDNAAMRSRSIERKLKDVQVLPAHDQPELFSPGDDAPDEDPSIG